MVKWDKRKRDAYFQAVEQKRRAARDSSNQGSPIRVERSEPFAQSVVAFFFAVLGSVLGAGAATFFSVNFLEEFKAEERLREFAVSQVYQPMRERSSECMATQHAIASNTLIIAKIYDTLTKGLTEYVKDTDQESLAYVYGNLLKPFTDQLNKSQDAIGSGTLELLDCADDVNHLGHELATVLGINSEYEKLLREEAQRRLELAKPDEVTNILADLLGEPSVLAALIAAIEDGSNGNPTRMLSAYNKIHMGLQQSAESYQGEYEYQTDVAHLMAAGDKARTELFLRNLKERFERKPSFRFDDLIGK